MGNENLDFQLWLRSKFDGDALKAAEAEFNRTKKAADGLGQSAEDLGYSMKSLKSALVEMFAAAEVFAQFKEGFEQVAKLEQVMNQLELQTKQNGHSFDDVKGKIVGFADQLKKVAGLDDDAVIAGMTKLYTATKNVDEAMNLARISADIAIATGKDYGTAQGLVMSAAQGNVRALRELGLSFDSTGDKQKDAEIGLAKLQKTFGGAAENAKGLTVEINRMKEKWEDVRNEIVDRVTPGISIAIKSVQTFFTALDGAWGVLADGLVRTVSIVGKFGSYLKSVATGDMAGMKDAVKGMGLDLAGIGTDAVMHAKDTASKIEAIWKSSQQKISGGEGKAKGIGAGAGGGTTAKQDQGDPNEFVLIGGTLYKRSDLLKATEDLYREARKKADLEEKFKELREKRERADAKKTLEEEKKDREDGFRHMTRLILEEVKMKKQAAEVERQMQLDVANAALGLAGDLFGDSKALAIAGAVINTYEGATKALAQGGIYGPILAAIVVASGLAQVAKISSTNPDRTSGSGFDDSRNDAAAYLGGRRWAADMIGEWTKGVGAGWSSGMGGGGQTSNTTNDNRKTFNVHMHGAGLMDPNNVQMAKQFKRTLDLIDVQIEGQRATARRAR